MVVLYDRSATPVEDEESAADTMLMTTIGGNNDGGHGNNGRHRRHPMYALAGQAQELLVKQKQKKETTENAADDDTEKFVNGIYVIDVLSMFEKEEETGIVEGEEVVDVKKDENDDDDDDDDTEEEAQRVPTPEELLRAALQKENDDTELTKGFGKYFVKFFQRMLFQNVIFVAGSEQFGGLAFKLYHALHAMDTQAISELVIVMYPTTTITTKEGEEKEGLTVDSINNAMQNDQDDDENGKKKKKKTAKKPKMKRNGRKKGHSGEKPDTTNQTTEQQQRKSSSSSIITAPTVATIPLHVILDDTAGDTKKEVLDLLRTYFPMGTTTTTITTMTPDGIYRRPPPVLITAAIATGTDEEEEEEKQQPTYQYDPEYFNDIGLSLFTSSVTATMSFHTKQYERVFVDIPQSTLLEIQVPLASPKNDDVIDDDNDTDRDGNHTRMLNNTVNNETVPGLAAAQYVGGFVVRGNRCLLVRSLDQEASSWDGMRIPIVKRAPQESVYAAAIRAVTYYADVEPEAVTVVPNLLPIQMYTNQFHTDGSKNNNNKVLQTVQLYVLYAAHPPPSEGPLEDADMEDEEDYYDWYTYPNAAQRLTGLSLAAIQGMAQHLCMAAHAKIVPNKWGGIFGQEYYTLPA